MDQFFLSCAFMMLLGLICCPDKERPSLEQNSLQIHASSRRTLTLQNLPRTLRIRHQHKQFLAAFTAGRQAPGVKGKQSTGGLLTADKRACLFVRACCPRLSVNVRLRQRCCLLTKPLQSVCVCVCPKGAVPLSAQSLNPP